MPYPPADKFQTPVASLLAEYRIPPKVLPRHIRGSAGDSAHLYGDGWVSLGGDYLLRVLDTRHILQGRVFVHIL